MKKGLLYTLLGLSLLGASCSESFLDENPSNKLGVDGSVKTVIQAQYAIDGVYDQLGHEEYWGNNFISNFDVMADDMRASESGRLDDSYRYTFYTESSDNAMWTRPYRAMKNAVSLLDVIDAVEAEGEDAVEDRNDIKGQALALRAMIHFDLVRTFGKPYTHGDANTALGVPIVTTKVNFDEKLARNTVEEVYTQVIKDLESAIALLKSESNTGRINKTAAQALLARVYLYKGDMTNALTYAETVINKSGLTLMSRKDYVAEWGTSAMSEAIFELVNSSDDNPGLESVGNLADPQGYGQFVATDPFIAKLKAAPYDIRSQLLAKDELSTKTEDRMGRVMKYPGNGSSPASTSNVRIIRLSEIYLIAAEAALGTNKAKAKDYLNKVISRAYPTDNVLADDGTVLFDIVNIPTVTEVTITLDRILEERSLELVSEGHRFHDLVRNNITIKRGADYWGNTYKEIEMTDHKIIQPIPRIELDANSKMVQNPGYDS